MKIAGMFVYLLMTSDNRSWITPVKSITVLFTIYSHIYLHTLYKLLHIVRKLK